MRKLWGLSLFLHWSVWSRALMKLSLITFCLRHEELKAAPDAAEIHSIKSDLSRALREVSANAAACALTGGIPEKAKASPPCGGRA